jgi:hypothetical protein
VRFMHNAWRRATRSFELSDALRRPSTPTFGAPRRAQDLLDGFVEHGHLTPAASPLPSRPLSRVSYARRERLRGSDMAGAMRQP